MSGESKEQVGGYLKLLGEKFRIIEKKLPVFATSRQRKGRYYIADNFLVAWLAALEPSVDAVNFRPLKDLVQRADEQLARVEGHALERLVGKLYEERSRKALPGFSLTERIGGYWDSADTDIDLVALDEGGQRLRFGSITWTIEYAAIAPRLDAAARAGLAARDVVAQDLDDLCQGLSDS